MADLTMKTFDTVKKFDRAFVTIGRPIKQTYIKNRLNEHGVMETYVDVQDIAEQAGLNWEVTKRPILTTSFDEPYDLNPDPLLPNGTVQTQRLRIVLEDFFYGKSVEPSSPSDLADEIKKLLNQTENSFIPNENDYSILRKDTNIPFGTFSGVYTPLDNEECIRIIEPLLLSGKAEIVRGGFFNHGANCWVIARLSKNMVIGSEEIGQYIKISWSHDGSEMLSATFIGNCARDNVQINPNLESAAVRIEIKHTTNARKRMEMASSLLCKGEHYFNKLETVLTELINSPWTEREMADYLQTLFPEKDTATDRKNNQEKSKKDDIMRIYRTTNSDIDNTKYAAFTSVVKWCDYEKTCRVTRKASNSDEETQRNESRMQSIWMKNGSGRKIKDEAFALIVK